MESSGFEESNVLLIQQQLPVRKYHLTAKLSCGNILYSVHLKLILTFPLVDLFFNRKNTFCSSFHAGTLLLHPNCSFKTEIGDYVYGTSQN